MGIKYYAGIDLGTTRTSIAASTGVTYTEVTCIGYPKDVISRKRLGKSYLLGQEALDNRLACSMVWPLSNGILESKDVRAIDSAKILLQEMILKAFPSREKDDEIYAAIGVPARASIESKKDIIALSKGIIDKLLIVSEPFAVAYGLDRFDECMIIDMGGGTIDICRISGAMPEPDDQITLTTAGNYLDKSIERDILGLYPNVQLTPQIVKRIKEKYGYVQENSDKIEVELTEEGIPKKYDLTELLRTCCLNITYPIAKAVQELVGSFDPEFQEKLRKNIIVAGGGSRLIGIDRAIEKSLDKYGGGSVVCTQDAEYGGAKGALKMALELPVEYWEQI